jgi:hypothetical protein
MPVIDAMVVRAPQPWQRELELVGIPDLDRFGADARFDHFPLEPGRHRIGVLQHADRGSLAHLHPQAHERLQSACGQVTQVCHFLGDLQPSASIASIAHLIEECLVLLTAGKIPAATQQQRLLHGRLETVMGLFAIAVLMPAVGVGRLGLDAIVLHERLVVAGEHLGVAVRMHGQGHAVGAVPPRHASQRPQRILQAFAQTGEAL